MLANVPVGEAICLWVEIRVVRSLKTHVLPAKNSKKFDKIRTFFSLIVHHSIKKQPNENTKFYEIYEVELKRR